MVLDIYIYMCLCLHVLYTVVQRPRAHTRPKAHPQTLENLNFFPSLFNVRVKADPLNF